MYWKVKDLVVFLSIAQKDNAAAYAAAKLCLEPGGTLWLVQLDGWEGFEKHFLPPKDEYGRRAVWTSVSEPKEGPYHFFSTVLHRLGETTWKMVVWAEKQVFEDRPGCLERVPAGAGLLFLGAPAPHRLATLWKRAEKWGDGESKNFSFIASRDGEEFVGWQPHGAEWQMPIPKAPLGEYLTQLEKIL